MKTCLFDDHDVDPDSGTTIESEDNFDMSIDTEALSLEFEPVEDHETDIETEDSGPSLSDEDLSLDENDFELGTDITIESEDNFDVSIDTEELDEDLNLEFDIDDDDETEIGRTGSKPSQPDDEERDSDEFGAALKCMDEVSRPNDDRAGISQSG